MKLMVVRPFGSRFSHFINFATSGNIFVHLPGDLLQWNAAEFSLNPLVGGPGEFKLDIANELPVA